MKKDKLSPSITLITIILVLTVIFAYANSLKRIFVKQVQYFIEHNALQKASELETSINYAMNSIKLVSEFTSSKMEERELKNPNEVLSSFSDQTPFNLIEYIRWDGLNLMNSSQGAEPFDASSRPYFTNGIKGNSGIWINYSPKLAKDILLNFYTPLYYDREIAGVLTGAILGQGQVSSVLKSSFFGQEIIGFLCDENFTIISSTDDGEARLYPGLNLYNHLNIKVINDIVMHGQNGDSKTFTYEINNKMGLCCVAKVAPVNWNVVYIVYPRNLSASMEEISRAIYLVSISISAILLLYLFIRLYLRNRLSKKTEKLQINIINALGTIYQNVYAVDAKTGNFTIYRMSNTINEKYRNSFSTITYKDAIAAYVKNEVIGEDRILFKAVCDVEKVKELLKDKNEYSFIYRIKRNNEIHYYQCYILRPSENSEEFVAAFKDVDQMMQKQIEDQQHLNDLIDMQTTQISILSSLSGIYLTSHLIDLEKDFVVEFNTTKEVRLHVKDNEYAHIQMKKVMEAVVIPEYLDEVLAFTNLSTIAKRLRGKKIISKEFIGNFHGWIRASFISVETDKDGIPLKVLFVTQVIDDEKRKEENLISTANQDELTGLYNRHAYETDLRELKKSVADENFVYISFDVNGLKTVNDTLGHEAGDELIRGAAECLTKAFGKYGKVYRSGGDEFQAIISADEQTLAKIKESFEVITEQWTGKLVAELRISAGYVTRAEDPQLKINDIVKLADQRMYKNKSLYYSTKGIDRRAQQAAFEALCHSYEKILKINLTTDEYSIIQMNDNEKEEVKGYSEKISSWLHDFVTSGQVHKDDAEEFLRRTDINYLKKFFADGNRIFDLHYRRKVDDTCKKVIMEMIPSNDYTSENQKLFLYVKDVEKKNV